jgi:hypothetical protein
MENVILNKNSIKVGKKTFKPHRLYQFLWRRVELNNITMRDLLKILKPRAQSWAIILEEPYLLDFVKCVDCEPSKSKKKITKIIASTHGTIDLRDNSKTKLITTKNVLTFKKLKPKGKLKEWKEFGIWNDVCGAIGKQRYAIDLCPINDYIDAKIEIDDQFTVDTLDCRMKSKHKFEKPTLMGNYDMTVLEFIKAIIYEITFHGSPNNVEKRRKDLDDRVDEVKKNGTKGYKKVEFK